MQPPSRRRLLRSIAAGIAASSAGCGSPFGDDSTPTADGTATDPTGTPSADPTPTDSTPTPSGSVQTRSFGETATAADTSVTLSDPAVRKILYSPDAGSEAHTRPFGFGNTQFLVVSVAGLDTGSSSVPLASVLNGTRETVPMYRQQVASGETPRLGFPLPVDSFSSVAIEWQTPGGERYRWAVPDSTADRLAQSPTFSVTAFDTPDTITRGESFSATLTVENTGDRAGQFVGVVLDKGASSVPLVSRFTVDIPAGESVTRELDGSAVRTEESSVMALLDWGIGQETADFSVSSE